ncbi:HAD family phosphatase [Candidatus Woesearchaeota archaeon]|nr:HAD family phosphatase [Candidatus Woesearchaeota archaeon]
MIKAILFDAEGVVVDSEHVWDIATTAFLQRYGIVYDRPTHKPLLTGQSLVDGVRLMKKLAGFETLVGDDVMLAQERMDIVQEMFRTSVTYVPGFEDFYQTVSSRYATCVATAMHKPLLRDVNRHLLLDKLFNGQVFSIDDVGGISKPDPAIFLYGARQLGVAPEHCMVIEDAPHGITAAKRAGMYCIGIGTTYSLEKLAEADQVVSTFSEIKIP